MSRTPSTRELAVGTTLAAVLVVVGGAIALRPETVLAAVPVLEPLLLGIDPPLMLVLLSFGLALLVATMAIFGRSRARSPQPLVSDADPLFSGSTTYRTVGRTFEGNLSTATNYDRITRDGRERARDRIRESLRPIAADAYASRAGVDREAAMAAVEDGTWTGDPRAAAFLATDAGPSIPLERWLIDLVWDDPFDRGLQRTLAEIERLQGGGSGAGAEGSGSKRDGSRSGRGTGS